MKRFLALCLLATAAGYISLTQEMLWFRAVSYTTGGEPVMFADVLGCFLVGAALGALLGNHISRRPGAPFGFLARALGAAAIVYFFMIPLSAYAFTVKGPGMVVIYLAVGLTALLSGTVLPIICQIAIREGEVDADGVGMSMSWIYAANIVGATLGPILTGFVLLNHFRLVDLMLYVSLATLMVALVVAVAAKSKANRVDWRLVGGLVAMMGVMVWSHTNLYSSLLEKLHFKHDYAKNGEYKRLVENRHGVIAVYSSEKRLEGHVTDVIYGGGLFDGTFNIDPLTDSNLIIRAYMMAALHRNPARVLVIGLSSGSWVRVLLEDPRIKRMDVVEINPGYLEIIKDYPAQAEILSDPRVTIYVDDGRRWLHRNPKETYDFILMNTSFHWREGSTNLLSQEFLQLCKDHMNPGGVIYYNTTASRDVKWTAAHVYQHATEFLNFVAASDAPFDMTPAEKLSALAGFSRSGRKILDDSSPEGRALVDRLVTTPFPELKDTLGPRANAERLTIISDDNMVTEFKPRDRRWVDETRTWSGLWARLQD